MSSRTTRILLVLVALAVGAYWYWSPYWALHQMRGAAEGGNADKFNAHVDYPRLRESLKGQLAAAMSAEMAKSKSGDGLESAGAAFGAMLGIAMVGGIVDAMVRPEVVMQAMTEAKLNAKSSGGSGTSKEELDKVQWSFERVGADKFIAYGSKPSEASRFGLVLERSGFADWKLTEMRLPDMNRR